MSDECVLPPTLYNLCSPCNSSICANRDIELLRIDNRVRMPSSLKTMLLSSGCGTQQKDPKFCSYERVYMRRRADGKIQSANTKCKK